MKREKGKVSEIKLAYIEGGSRGWAWGLMGDLAMEASMSGTIHLYDIDHEAAANNQKIGTKMFALPEAKGRWDLVSSPSLQEALNGADFVIISILPATYKEMQSDVHAPEQYGIYQAVGDTVGPGGVFRALRTIPIYQEIAANIKQLCPEAWVINYTNPMTVCTRTLYEAFPGIKAFGCCHEVFGTQVLLAEALKEMEGIEGIERHEIAVNVKGINHFTWLDQASYQGRDLLPLYREFIRRCGKDGYAERGREYAETSVFGTTNLVKFDLFERYGLIAAAGDRHLAEFCPGWYLKNPETVRRWGFHLTPVSFRESELVNRNQRAADMISGKEPVEIKPSGEEGVRQMKALLGLGDLTTNVNLPNMGQIPSLPFGAVVETNAVFAHNSIRPVAAGELPQEVNSLVCRHVVNQEQVVKGGFARDVSRVFNAFANDPLVALPLQDAKELFRTMYTNTKEYLGGYSNLPE